ncbi:MAG: hypothetical protein R3B68_15720 [Phycisphaerales bacterium]
MDVHDISTVPELVARALADTDAAAATISGQEQSPPMLGFAELGISWTGGAAASQAGLDDARAYRDEVAAPAGAAWMDNTTLVSALALLSDRGHEIITPLNLWDLATFCRAVVCYERIYHHAHKDFDDAVANGLLGGPVFVPVQLPTHTGEGSLPTPWEGAFRLMCDVWADAHHWLKRLHTAETRSTLDGRQMAAVTAAWRTALGRNDLYARHLADYSQASTGWDSPSNTLLVEMASITGIDETRIILDPQEDFRRLDATRKDLGLPDGSDESLARVLTNLNLRCRINQRLAEFFRLPYAAATSRVPFRRHLYDRALAVQQELVSARVLDDRYAEIGGDYRVPVFLALALRGVDSPYDVLARLAALRKRAGAFRAHRETLDAELSRGNLKEARRVAKALRAEAQGLLGAAGDATAAARDSVIDGLARGDAPEVGTAISATAAATKKLAGSTFAERLLWRVRRPHLLWLNNMADQAERLTAAMPEIARIWRIPPSQQQAFAERTTAMAVLETGKAG